MFKNLLQFWKGKDFLSQVLEEFKGMLEDARDMFDSVCRKLICNEDVVSLKDRIYILDKKVNDLEKGIRKRIVEHLSLQPAVDVPTCLLLMSVVKDAERLGDYCKNLFEITQLLDRPVDKGRYLRLFNNMEQEISELFKQAKDAFIESDETRAAQAWSYETKIVKKCDKIIEQLAKGGCGVNEAVCFTLIARYFKRLVAHLTNIATSVILPIDELDYYNEERRRLKKAP
jgi:phosphate uptake regulator